MISEDPYDPHPRIVVSPNEATPLVREERVISPRKDQPKELEEEDVGSSAQVVELVELELPGTQPCNRPREETKKRTRSNSPNRDSGRTSARQESPTRPPLESERHARVTCGGAGHVATDARV